MAAEVLGTCPSALAAEIQGGDTTHAPAGFACCFSNRACLKEVAVSNGWIGQGACVWGREAGPFVFMPEFPFLKLLVVTALFAWFNFRAWQKRL
jgi:hypothetical protein